MSGGHVGADDDNVGGVEALALFPGVVSAMKG